MQEETMIQLVFSAVLAFATVAYTVATILMFVESVKSRKLKTKPDVIPYLQTSDNHKALMLCVKNIGEGCARNVQIKVLKDYYCFGKENLPLSHYHIFQEGVTIFPSGYELHYYLDNAVRAMSQENGYVEMVVCYSDENGKSYKSENYKLVFNQISQSYSNPPETNEGKIAYYLKEISDSLKKYQKQSL